MSDNATMQEIHDYLEECAKKTGTFYLMTVDGDKPACRPVSFHMLVDGKEYFGVGTFKDAYKQMVANPNVQIVGCKGANWIRVSGTAVFDNDRRCSRRLWRPCRFSRTCTTRRTVERWASSAWRTATLSSLRR